MLNSKQMKYSRHGWSPPDNVTRATSGKKVRIHVVPALPVVDEVEHNVENIEGSVDVTLKFIWSFSCGIFLHIYNFSKK